jgi:glutamate-1-semialdehyde 2,1-aminomutase
MLLSKRPEMMLPDHWPTYYSRAKGCRVWDLDGREFIDMANMSVGACSLGYGHPEVDEAVRQAIDAGNMSTLNCPEEVQLAERLVELHPWADMVRLARTGGEANAIAVRIARAASGRDTIAVCGYHGWHDWYLAANLGDEENLDGHLLPGLNPDGVPRALAGTVRPFRYNCIEELESLVSKYDIGVVNMEVMRSEEPEDGFLEKVRTLTRDKGIVLIFDECTSGFRNNLGGLHQHFSIEPDMAVFGKALGNGYAISAVIGRREIMDYAQSSFISSTFWTERIGPAAALKTLDVMEREKSWEKIRITTKLLRNGWEELGSAHDLKLEVGGMNGIPSFNLRSENAAAYKTFVTQEMLNREYLASTSVYVCTEHAKELIDRYFDQLSSVFALIKKREDCEISDFLSGPICDTGFRRLN